MIPMTPYACPPHPHKFMCFDEGLPVCVAHTHRHSLTHTHTDRYDSEDSWLVTSSEINEEYITQQKQYLQMLNIGPGGKAAGAASASRRRAK